MKDKHLLLMTGFSHDLRAIGHIDNIPWFVGGALRGEKVQVHALKQHAHRVDAELVAVEQAAAARIKPACEYCTRCGGCDLLTLPLFNVPHNLLMMRFVYLAAEPRPSVARTSAG